MIWLWLWQGILMVLRLVLPVVPPVTRIDPQGPCPACGNKGGSLQFVRQPLRESQNKCSGCGSTSTSWAMDHFHCNECSKDFGMTIDTQAFVMKSCATCSFKYLLDPVSAPERPVS